MILLCRVLRVSSFFTTLRIRVPHQVRTDTVEFMQHRYSKVAQVSCGTYPTINRYSVSSFA